MSGVSVLQEGRVVRITLNREEHRNMLTSEMAHTLIEALSNDSDDVGSFLLQGAGTFFCYGGAAGLPQKLWTSTPRNKPLIAAVQGAALGVGLALVAMSHIAIAAQGTSFGILDIRNKTCPPALDTIAAAIGWRRTTELSLSGRTFSAPEALQIGLIYEIAPAFEFDDRAEAMAQLLAQADPQAVRQILQAKRGLTIP